MGGKGRKWKGSKGQQRAANEKKGGKVKKGKGRLVRYKGKKRERKGKKGVNKRDDSLSK